MYADDLLIPALCSGHSRMIEISEQEISCLDTHFMVIDFVWLGVVL